MAKLNKTKRIIEDTPEICCTFRKRDTREIYVSLYSVTGWVDARRREHFYRPRALFVSAQRVSKWSNVFCWRLIYKTADKMSSGISCNPFRKAKTQ